MHPNPEAGAGTEPFFKVSLPTSQNLPGLLKQLWVGCSCSQHAENSVERMRCRVAPTPATHEKYSVCQIVHFVNAPVNILNVEIFLDTETTGLSHQRDRIVEIALVDEEGNVLLDTLVNPNRQIPVQASRVHGITDQMVRKKKNIYALLPQINALIGGHDLIAYNAPFDIGFFPDQLSKAASVTCAMRVFAEFRGEKKALKLSEAAKIVGHEWSGNAHRALADTLACKSVWEATLKARKAGKLASAKKAPRPPKIIYEDELDQWAADSMRRLIRKFLAKKMSKATLLEVLVSEGALMGLTDSSMTRKEMDSIIKEAIDRSTAIAES